MRPSVSVCSGAVGKSRGSTRDKNAEPHVPAVRARRELYPWPSIAAAWTKAICAGFAPDTKEAGFAPDTKEKDPAKRPQRPQQLALICGRSPRWSQSASKRESASVNGGNGS
jgi:hypothetical protein